MCGLMGTTREPRGPKITMRPTSAVLRAVSDVPLSGTCLDSPGHALAALAVKPAVRKQGIRA